MRDREVIYSDCKAFWSHMLATNPDFRRQLKEGRVFSNTKILNPINQEETQDDQLSKGCEEREEAS